MSLSAALVDQSNVPYLYSITDFRRREGARGEGEGQGEGRGAIEDNQIKNKYYFARYTFPLLEFSTVPEALFWDSIVFMPK